jgi:hypothetical protein
MPAFLGKDGSVVLWIEFDPVAGPDETGSVTVTASGGTLTIGKTDYSDISGSLTLPAEQKADPANMSALYTGTFAFAITPDTTAALSGTVQGSFDSYKTFCPVTFTDLLLSPILGASDFSLKLHIPIAVGGTASVIIKPPQ